MSEISKQIHKYHLRYDRDQCIEMPAGAKVISAGVDPVGVISIWAIVDYPAKEHVLMPVALIPTGHPLPTSEVHFIGTVRDGQYMWHVFIGPEITKGGEA